MAPWVHRHSLLLAKQNRDSDHDRARDAVSAGDVLPLQQILRCLGRRYSGRLLVVEDDKDLARQLQAALSDAGHAVDLTHLARRQAYVPTLRHAP